MHLFTPDQVNSPSCSADNTNPPYGPVSGDGLYVGNNSNNTSSKKTTVRNLTVKGSGTSDPSQAEAKIQINPNKNINGDENKFQGSVKIRRLTPTKSIGAYEGGESEEEAKKKYGEIEGIPGMGTMAELTEEQKNMLMQGSLKGASVASFDELVYLTIPYIPFDSNGENTKEGHMIVNKSLAEDVLNIFYELYLANYPIASMEVAESFLENTEVENSTVKDKEDLKTTQNRDELGEISADNNNTVALYYDKYETSSHMLGNAIDLNPQINPKTIDSSRRTETFNAQTYVNRDQKETWGDEAQKAFIDKDSIPYKIFTKYGWTWGGEGGSSADYGHFQKTSSTESNAKEEPIESVYCDLSYVDEQTFNSYVATGDKRALYVFTLNSTRDLITASWSYDSEKGFTVTKSNPIGYRKALGKYTMPIEYLNIMLVHSKSINFIENLAALGANSEYVITIKDTVEVSQVTRQISTNETIFRENGDVYSEDSTSIKTITVTLERASQTPEVTYVNNWYVIYIANVSGISEELLKYDANLGTGGKNVNVKGTKTEKNDQTTNVTSEEQEYEIDLDSLTNQTTPQDHGGSNGEMNYDSTTGNLTEAKKEEGKKVDITTEVTTTGTITYKYSSGNTGKVIKHYERFEEIYKAAGQTARNNLYLPWVTSSLEKNQKTANLVEVTQYLLSSIETDYYEPLTGKNFSEDFAPDDFGTVTGSNASGTLNIAGGSAEEKVINALRSKGYSDVAIAAVMGNIYGESGFDPAALEGGSGPGFGLCQWTGNRRTQLESFAASRGKQPSDIDIQVEFLLAELDPAGGADGFANYEFSGREGERQTWMTSTDIATATTAFCAGFERPSVPRNQTRIDKATEYYNTIVHK